MAVIFVGRTNEYRVGYVTFLMFQGNKFILNVFVLSYHNSL